MEHVSFMTSDQLFFLVNMHHVNKHASGHSGGHIKEHPCEQRRSDNSDSSSSAKNGASLRSHWEDHPQTSQMQRECSSVLSPILLKPGVFSSSQVAPKMKKLVIIFQRNPSISTQVNIQGLDIGDGEVHIPDWTGLSM